MTQAADLPYPVPEPHEWIDVPDPGTQRAYDEAMADVAAGRSVICTSEEALDALLAELAADPRTNTKAS
ncbi:hypothetical protein [Parafrankia sp. EUN1f]|uniref:hypothetical protein n=1 Tax=Parafrankia sp. EUN1f TaxID=102897 RepID=UPI0001C45A16|nr:hypothetical protein [Parafrankia sp. EUN1f]EFC83956.1 hypothetical protein FrEUN1fDRAFT_2912 [Parafrankia sp. EUN1f]